MKRFDIEYPKNEIVWVSYLNSDHELRFILTSKMTRDFYYLYEIVDGKPKKLGRAKSPSDLEERFAVNEVLSK